MKVIVSFYFFSLKINGWFISDSLVLSFSVYLQACVCVAVLLIVVMMCNERSQLDANSHVKWTRQEVLSRGLTSLQ